jgi:hypothetical protein
MVTFGSFLEHVNARFERERILTTWSYVPSIKESHVFWLGDDKEFYNHIIEVRKDILAEMKEKIPMPYRDVSCVSVVKGFGKGPIWTFDRVIEEPDYLHRLIEGEDEKVYEKIGGQKLLIIRCQEEERLDGKLTNSPILTWTIGYKGVIDGNVHFDYCPGKFLLDGIHDKFTFDTMSGETKMILDEIVAISHPMNYVVQVTPKLTPHEERRAAAGKSVTMQKSRHFIVVDHEVIVRMRRDPDGTHASPIPHHRRGHWMRLADRCRHARLMGKEKVFVKPTIVGDPKWESEKNFYEVLPDLNKPMGVSV